LSRLRWPIVAGLSGSAFLVLLYFGIVSLVQSLSHALELLWTDRFFVAAIAGGFGLQIGLFTYVKLRLHLSEHTGSSTALAATGTGTSSVAMVACCVHHLTEVLPLIGLSGAAIFLSQYRTPIMALGLVTNAVGMLVMIRHIRRERRKFMVAGPTLAETE
jgi:hypothetical protein